MFAPSKNDDRRREKQSRMGRRAWPQHAPRPVSLRVEQLEEWCQPALLASATLPYAIVPAAPLNNDQPNVGDTTSRLLSNTPLLFRNQGGNINSLLLPTTTVRIAPTPLANPQSLGQFRLASSNAGRPLFVSTSPMLSFQPVTASSANTLALLGSNGIVSTQTPMALADSAAILRHELVIVDPLVADYQQLVADMTRNDPTRMLEVVVLRADADGIAQVTQILSQYQLLDAVHLVTHGAGNGIVIGDTWLNVNNADSFADQFHQWRNALSPHADLLFYACNLAQNDMGRQLLNDISAWTGADVAASADATGSSALGGNWRLEFSNGVIDSTVVASENTQTSWNSLLATITVSNTSDIVNGDTSTIAKLIATPGADGISLREAVIAANNTLGKDEIIIPAGTIVFTASGSEATNTPNALVNDLDITEDLKVRGAGKGVSIIDANKIHRVFQVFSGTELELRDVTIQGGLTDVTSGLGGGIYAQSATLNLQRVHVTGNSATYAGGGITGEGSNVLLTDVLIDANSTSQYGGGLQISSNGSAILNRVTISNNTALKQGGGIYDYSGGAVTLTNTTISGNSAVDQGGGILTRHNMTMTNVTLAFNSSAAGAGFYLENGPTYIITAINSIFAKNTGQNSNKAFDAGSNNIDTDGTAALSLTATLAADPKLDSRLMNNGGFVPTHQLLGGSPAIDGGVNTNAPIDDARGYRRIDGRTDIGAFERNAIRLTKIYWVDQINRTIQRANLDGSNVETILSAADGVNSPTGLIIDAINGKLYWSEYFAGNIRCANLDGSNIQTLYSGLSSPAGLALDVANNMIYWTENPLFFGSNRIRRGNSNGSGPIQDLVTTGSNDPVDIQLDLGLGKLYWTDGNNGEIRCANLNGTGVSVYLAGLTNPQGLRLDPSARMIYWASNGFGANKIQRANLDGPPVTQDLVTTGLSSPIGLELDLTNGRIYWSDFGTNKIQSANLDGTNVQDVVATGLNLPIGVALGIGSNVAPTITSNGGGAAATVTIPENTTAVTTVAATDDGLPSGTLTYSITGGADSIKFNIDSTTGVLRFVTVPDFESPTDVGTNNAYDVTVQVSDGSRTNTQTIAVTVANVNEAPVGVNDVYTVLEDNTLTTTGSWFNNAWTRRNIITFNNLAGPALFNEAVLITLDSSNINYAQTQNSGQDIRFVDGDGTLLDYEIENWDETGTSTVWVRVPQIDAASSSDYISMYYGNAAAVDAQNPAGVWISGAQAVLHLNGTPSDSSPNSLTVAQSGTTGVAGYIAGGRQFDGVTGSLSLGSPAVLDNLFAGGGTVSAWFNASGWGEAGYGRIASHASSTFSFGALGDGWAIQLDNVYHAVLIEQGASTQTGRWRTPNNSVALNNWYMVTVVYDSSSTANDPRIFINGVEVTVTQATAPLGTITSDAAQSLVIGNHSTATTRTFDGVIDEFRVYTTNRSPAQILADYQSMTRVLTTVGAAQTGPGGVLTNDTDPENDSLTASLVSGPSNGAIIFNADGSFTYTPNPDFNGVDSFTYQANDGSLNSNVTTVTINVTPVNDAPVTFSDSYTISEDGKLTVPANGVLANDSDVDGDPLTAVLVAGPSNAVSFTLFSDGSFSYTPLPNFSGADSFIYVVNDGTIDGNVVAVTIDVVAINDSPIRTLGIVNNLVMLEDSGVTTLGLGSLNYGPGGGVDEAGQTQTYRVTAVPAAALGNIVLADGVTKVTNGGTYTLAQFQGMQFKVAADAFGGPANFRWSVRDNGGTANGGVDTLNESLTITVTSVNDQPVLTAGTVNNLTVLEDSGVTSLGLGTLAYGPGGGTFEASQTLSYKLTAVPAASLGAIVLVDGVTVVTAGTNYTLAQLQGMSFKTVLNANGGPVTFSWIVKDNGGTANGGVDTLNQSLTITITAVDDAPVAKNDSYSVNEDTTLTININGVLSNDSDVEGDVLTAILVSGPTNGVLSLNPDGTFTYTPSKNFNGTDSFTYRASDGLLNSNIATVTLTVNPVNDAPVAANDSYSVNKNVTLTISAPGVLGNDTDVDNATLTSILVSGPSNGSLTFQPDGSFVYTPNLNFVGIDSFKYIARDGKANSNTVTVNITVNPVNYAPVAKNDSFTTNEDTSLVVLATGVLNNDSDVDNTTLTAALVSGPANGTLTLKPDGSFTYTPNANFNGIDSFTYVASDGSFQSNVAKVSITVRAVNDNPVGVGDSYVVNEDATLTVPASGVLKNDSDVDQDVIKALLLSSTSNGTLVLNADGSFTYTPNADFNGSDSFTYVVTDGLATSSPITVSIDVQPVNDSPIAANDTYRGQEDTTVVVAAAGVLANDTDLDGDPLKTTVVIGPGNGTLTLNTDGSFTFVPNADFNGLDSFTYAVSDGVSTSNEAKVSIYIAPVNDAPVAVRDQYTTTADKTLTVTASGVLSNDSDVDDKTFTAKLSVPPSHGTVTLSADGSFIYVPNAKYVGADTFRYSADDGRATSNATTVTIEVKASTVVTLPPIVNPPVPVPVEPPGTPTPTTKSDTKQTTTSTGPISSPTGVTQFVNPGSHTQDSGAEGLDPALILTARPTAPTLEIVSTATQLVDRTTRSDRVATSLTIRAPEVVEALPTRSVMSLAADNPVFSALDRVSKDLKSDVKIQVVADAVVATGVVVSAGYVLLNTKIMYWFISALLVRPAVWSRFDPIDVLYAWDEDEENEDSAENESLQSMVS